MKKPWQPNHGRVWMFNRMAGTEPPRIKSNRYVSFGPGETGPLVYGSATDVIDMPNDDTWWTKRLSLYDFEGAYKKGVRDFFVWPTPWGIRTINVDGVERDLYSFDALIEAQAANMKWLTNGFIQAFTEWMERHDDTNILFYYGHVASTTGIGKLTGAAWFNRAMVSLAPILALSEAFPGRVSLGIDMASIFPKHAKDELGGELWQIRNALTSMIEVSAEAMPLASAPHWADGPIVTTEESFDASKGGNQNYVPHDQIVGPVRVVLQRNMTADEVKKKMAETLDDGRPVDWLLLGLPELFRQGIEFGELNQ